MMVTVNLHFCSAGLMDIGLLQARIKFASRYISDGGSCQKLSPIITFSEGFWLLQLLKC